MNPLSQLSQHSFFEALRLIHPTLDVSHRTYRQRPGDRHAARQHGRGALDHLHDPHRAHLQRVGDVQCDHSKVHNQQSRDYHVSCYNQITLNSR